MTKLKFEEVFRLDIPPILGWGSPIDGVEYNMSCEAVKISLSTQSDAHVEQLRMEDITHKLTLYLRVHAPKNASITDELKTKIVKKILEKKDGETSPQGYAVGIPCREVIEKTVRKFKREHSTKLHTVIKVKSKTVGIEESISTGTEWVERNSNRLGLDSTRETFDYFFTPEYQIVTLTLLRKTEYEINQFNRSATTRDADWQMYLDIENCRLLLEELGLTPRSDQTLYVKELNRDRIKLDDIGLGPIYPHTLNPFKDRALLFDDFYHHESFIHLSSTEISIEESK